MPFLLRVALPDVPGSLGRVATAIGEAGGDIEAIEIVEHGADGVAIDDVLLETLPGVMPDSIVSACNALEDVEVIWISRYAAGGNIFLDLEVVEALTSRPDEAVARLLDLLPITFRVDWAACVRRDGEAGEIVGATEAAPAELDWVPLGRADRLPPHPDDEVTLRCGAPLPSGELVVLGRRGGPDFLDSELARLGHLVSLAASIAKG